MSKIKRTIKSIKSFLNFDVGLPTWLVYPVYTLRRNKRIRDFPVGTLIEDCNYHPCIIMENDEGDITSFDIINHTIGGCSLFHCGVCKITPDDVSEMVRIYKVEGDKGLVMEYGGWSSEDYDKFSKEWRNV